jgi:hypothetical protein
VFQRGLSGSSVELGDITEAERDAVLAFTFWWLYRCPAASCSGLYERMLSGGFGDEYVRVSEVEPEERLRRIKAHKKCFARWVVSLGGSSDGSPERVTVCGKSIFTPALRFPPRRGKPFGALTEIGPYLKIPAYVLQAAAGDVSDSLALSEKARFKRAV